MKIDYHQLSDDFSALEMSCRLVLRGLQEEAETARQTLVGLKDDSPFAAYVYDHARDLDRRLVAAQNDLAYDLVHYSKFKDRCEYFTEEVKLVVEGAKKAVKSP